MINLGLVFYKADEAEFVEKLRKLSSVVDNLIVFLNSSISDLPVFENLTILGTTENVGIGCALNEISRFALSRSWSFVIFLDQDTGLTSEHLDLYRVHIAEDKYDFVFPAYEEGQLEIQCLTSASLNRVSMIRQNGFFDEGLFIDEVDGFFFYRMSKNFPNVRIFMDRKIIVAHKLGEKKHRRLLGRQVVSDNHSPLRKYYIARNRTYLGLRHRALFLVYCKDSFIKLMKMLLVEDKIVLKSVYIVHGIIHGIFGRLGKR